MTQFQPVIKNHGASLGKLRPEVDQKPFARNLITFEFWMRFKIINLRHRR